MKKLLFGAAIAALALTVASCNKTYITPYNDGGETPEGWQITPVQTYDPVSQLIVVSNDAYNGNVGQLLTGKELPNTGTQKVYAVKINSAGNRENISAELSGRKWQFAPLAYFIALGENYNPYFNLNEDIICFDVPVMADMGKGIPEHLGVRFGGMYNGQNGQEYNLGLNFFSESYVWGNGQRILCIPAPGNSLYQYNGKGN